MPLRWATATRRGTVGMCAHLCNWLVMITPATRPTRNTPAIRVPTDVEEEERGDDHRQADEHVVGVDGDEVAVGHRHRIDVMVAERLDELLSDHGRVRRTEVVEQEVDDSRCQIGDCVGGQQRGRR